MLRHSPLLTLLFFSLAISAPAGLQLEKKVLQEAESRFGSAARIRLEDWQTLIKDITPLSEEKKLKKTNEFFNEKVRFVNDIDHWGEKDYWATPVETLATHGGDCEDFSIAKYFTLLQAGVDDSKLRITYVKATTLNQAHMVVTYYPTADAIPLVLDNLVRSIFPSNLRKDLVPVYSFNGRDVWNNQDRGRGKRLGPSTGIDAWSQLKQRMTSSDIRQPIENTSPLTGRKS
ncbi:MAG: sulfate adenylyltransferase [Gammaproteobacteria bacterium]|nr:sulfate adenylyltransferase [Gammaproteobacteria bacterium]MBT7308625.1 sulfate adenylyltransferase [Gammaproteobacteria bacterium]